MRSPRRYTQDSLLYESFYVSIINALIIGFAPPFIMLFLAAVEDYPMNRAFFLTLVSVLQVAFIVGFLVNFLYYIYFIRARKSVLFFLTLLISCGLAFILFFSNFKNMFTDEHNAIIIGTWLLLLMVILVANKTGWLFNPDHKYERESWLLKHEMADRSAIVEDESDDRTDGYLHRYIDHHDEDAPDEAPKPIDPEDDPKRASRLT